MAHIIQREMTMVPLVGETPADIADAYAKAVNAAYNSPRDVYSVQYGDMVAFNACYTSLEQIDGQWFAEIEWGVSRPMSRAEFYGGQEDESEDE